jgi:hypothetical protein
MYKRNENSNQTSNRQAFLRSLHQTVNQAKLESLKSKQEPKKSSQNNKDLIPHRLHPHPHPRDHQLTRSN